MFACSGNHSTRLIVGEAGFKWTEAYIRKHSATHPNLARSIVASELNTFGRSSEECTYCDEIKQTKEAEIALCSGLANLFVKDGEKLVQYPEVNFFCSEFCQRIKKLQDLGVTIILGLDAAKIHLSDHPSIQGKRFSRIHWNCPHNRSNFFAQTLPKLIRDFFTSSSYMQQPGDRIHITLAQPPGAEAFYQGVIYDIRGAAVTNNYCLYAKRPFGAERYPGYEHEITGFNQAAESASVQREFIFIKRPFELPTGRRGSGYTMGYFSNPDRGYSFTRQYYIRDTDEESSNCSTDAEEENDSPLC